MLYKRYACLFRLFSIAVLSIFASACDTGSGPSITVDSGYVTQSQYELVWADEFNTGTRPDVANWSIETGYGENSDGWGNDEWQLYTESAENLRVEGGNLVISARCSTAPNCGDGATNARTGTITSARINTKNKFEIKYGKIQARIKMPPGKGSWPAFWMLGSSFPEQSWPGAGEIDIVEMHQFYSNDKTTHFTMHWCNDAVSSNPCEYNPGWTFDSQFRTFDERLTDDFHVFEADWDETRITGKIDGVTYFTRTIDPATMEEFLNSFFMILNVAVGGTLGGPPSASISWPQEMMVDWVRVYKKPQPEVLELLREDAVTRGTPYARLINSVEFGGDSVISDPESKKVKPLVGKSVLELDYESANTFFSGGAFGFNRVDLTGYEKLVFSLDSSAFPGFDDIRVEMNDNRFTGDGSPGNVSLPLSNYTATVSGNWNTYEIPLTDFNGVNLDNITSFGFWNPVNSADQLIAGKLYLDNILFVNVPCTSNGVVNFNADSYLGYATTAQITLTDTCLANKNKKVVVVVDNGTESIGVSIAVDATGSGSATINFGTTSDATSTIAIKEGDVLTLAYTDSNGVDQSDTASIVTPPLGVYTETHVDNVLAYSAITNVNTATDEASAAVVPLEGSVSMQADFSVPPVGSENGYAFVFPVPELGGLLVNAGFESNDASGGEIKCGPAGSTVDSWDCFNESYVSNVIPTAHSGTQVLKQFGFDAGASQIVAVSPGDTVYASAYAMSYTADPFQNLAIMLLAFFDAGDVQTGVSQVLANTLGNQDYTLTPQDGNDVTDWTRMDISAVAPADTAKAQIVLLHILTDGTPASGSLFWDDVSLGLEPAPQVVTTNDISYFKTLKFGINTSSASGLMDMEARMKDNAAVTASVFLSNYTPTPSTVPGWDVYEIPLSNFAGLDLTDVSSLGFYNASSTVTGSTSATPTYFASTVYFDDVHFTLQSAAVLTGILADSPIEGVTFETATQSGTTSNLGEFQYLPGETVTFSIGGIVLGTAQGAGIITPVELTGSSEPTNQTATNLLVFLQSIDQDQDASNGIQISAATQAAAAGLTLDFTLNSTQFSAAVTSVVAAIAPGNAVVSEQVAIENYYLTFPPSGSGATSTISASPSTVDSNGTAVSTITVQAKDSSGNNITVTAGAVTLSSLSGSVVISPVVDNANGTYTATVSNAVAETVTITGTIAGEAITDDAAVIFIGAVSGADTTISAAPSTVEADGIAISTITVTAKDANGNNFVSSAGTLTLSAASTSGAAVISTVTDNQNGTYTATVKNTVAENVTITGAIDTGSGTVAIVDDAIVTFVVGAVSGAQTTITAVPVSAVNNGSDTSTITVQAKDAGGNNLTSSAGEVRLRVIGSATLEGTGVVDNGDGTYTARDNTDGTYTATVVKSNTTAEVITVTGTIAGDDIVDDASITFGPSAGVYSDTNNASVLSYSEIVNTVAGCKSTTTTEVNTLVWPSLEGVNSLQADYTNIGTGGDCNGFVFNFIQPASAMLSDYKQDFEGLDINSATALSADGYKVFAAVWDDFVGGTFLYQYGPFAAPNGGAGFSAIATGEGGAAQGSQYINIYSDYNNADQATKVIETTVFQERSIDAGDISAGNVYSFSFDYKAPFVNGITPPTTSYAFIKTLNPAAGFAVTNLVTVDMSTPDNTVWGTASISIELSDALLAGQLLQFGWTTVTTNYNDSGVFYDNLSFSNPPVDISGYATLKFAIDSSLVVTPAMADLEVKMEDANSGVASVYLSNYTPTTGNVAGANWNVYEIPITDFAGTLDKTIIKTLGFYNASSDVFGDPSYPTLLDGSVFVDDIYYIEQP